MNNMTKKILYVENDLDEVNYIKDNIIKTAVSFSYNVEISSERSIDDAIATIDANSFDTLILDTMLPKDNKTLEKLEALEKTRKEKWTAYIDILDNPRKQTDNKSSLDGIKRDLKEIDNEIDKILVLEGGIKIAEHASTRNKNVSIMIFTGRGDDALIDKCNKKNWGWVEKPATIEELFLELRRLWDNQQYN